MYDIVNVHNGDTRGGRGLDRVSSRRVCALRLCALRALALWPLHVRRLWELHSLQRVSRVDCFERCTPICMRHAAGHSAQEFSCGVYTL